MNQWNTLNCDATIFENHTSLGGIDWIKHDLETKIMRIELQLAIKFVAQLFGAMYMQLSCASQQTKGGYHSNQSEAMITMQMGDKHMTKFGETNSAFS